MTPREVLCLSLGVDLGVILMLLNYAAANWYGPRLNRRAASRSKRTGQRQTSGVA